MKKCIVISLICALMLCVALAAVPTADAVNTEHNKDHCVCGSVNGGVNGHTCKESTDWTGWTAWPTADALPNAKGKYYLTTDVTLSGAFEISANVTLCLNGNTINSTSGRAINVKNGSLTVCDCSEGQTGVITANGGNITGGVIRMNENSQLDVYGGSIIAKGASNGGCIYSSVSTATVNVYGGVLDGVWVKGNGGCIYLEKAQLNIYGGTLTGGTAATDGDCIYVKGSGTLVPGKVNIYGGTVKGEIAAGSYAEVAVTNIEGGFLKLSGDYTANITMQDDLTVDLNGKVLSGTINTNGHNLYIADSTAQVAGVGTGKMKAQITGKIMQGNAMLAYAGDVAGHRYVTVNGSVYRIYVGFDTIQLTQEDDKSVGMNYVTNFQAHEDILDLLVESPENNYAIGCLFGVDNLDNAKTVGYSKTDYKARISTDIDNILTTETGRDNETACAKDICARAFIWLQIDGEPVGIFSKTYSYSLQDVIDALYKVADLETANKAAYDLLMFIEEEYSIEATPAA